MNTLCATPDYFALFLYIRPDNKVKLNSIMVFWIEGIIFPFFYNHLFVTEQCLPPCYNRVLYPVIRNPLASVLYNHRNC